MKVTPKHAICENDGKLGEVSVPGSCDTQIVLRKADKYFGYRAVAWWQVVVILRLLFIT